MADELIDIYDADMNLIGQAMKSQAHREGLWHKTFHCWIVRRPNKIWFQLRGKDKPVFPDMLDTSVAGHLGAGEKPKDGIREAEEEIGLSIDSDRLNKLFTFKEVQIIPNMNIREFYATYLYETDKALTDLKMQPEEVDGVFEADIGEAYNIFFDKVKEIKVEGLVRNGDNTYSAQTRVVSLKDFAPHDKEFYQKVLTAACKYMEK